MHKRSKRHRRLILIIKLTTILMLFGGLVSIILLLNYRLMVVKNLDVKLFSINCTDTKSVADSSKLTGDSLITIDDKKIEKSLKEQYPCIRNITLIRHFPNTVKVEVWGRESVVSFVQLDQKIATPAASFENIATPSAEEISRGHSYTVDEEGIIFSESKVEGLPIIYSFGEPISSVKEVVRVIGKLKTFGLDTKDGYLNQMATFMVNTYPKIIFNLSGNVDVQLASLQLILEQAKIKEENLQFIDLRFDRPVIRLAPRKN